jgi:hypothetical protein
VIPLCLLTILFHTPIDDYDYDYDVIL